MWHCFNNKIWLIFLSAHTSYVLQPLDVGVFSALKRRYCQQLSLLAMVYGTEESSKEFFLRAYSKARIYSQKPTAIRKAWEATGIFPRDRVKAKNSRLVAQNNNTAISGQLDGPTAIPIDSELAAVVLKTPHSSRQIRAIESELRGVSDAYKLPTVRLLFRKLCKGLDELATRAATAEAENEVLVAALEQQKPRKKRRVVPDPNQAFVDIVAIGKERAAMGLADEDPAPTLEASGSEDEDEVEELECIVVHDSESDTSLSDCE